MKPIILEDNCALFCGDSKDVGTVLAPNSIDSLITDPPCGIGFMGKEWDGDKGGRDQWVAWLAEILRPAFAALKPGGHGLVWAIPRTMHWTMSALEDAGFEIRDIVHHAFGTGFPKSLDVSKAVDAQDAKLERRRRALSFTEWIRAAGVTAAEINRLTSSNMGSHYTTAAAQPEVATADMFDLIRPALPAVPAWVEDLVRARTVESQNLKARKVLRTETMTDTVTTRPGFAGPAYNEAERVTKEVAITAPHSPEAERWRGFGTALKPAIEPWILVRKPLAGTVAENVLAHGCGAINVDACRIGGDAEGDALGRWPAHLVLSHNDDCVHVGDETEARGVFEGPRIGDTPGNLEFGMGRQAAATKTVTNARYECSPGCAVAELDEQSGTLKSGTCSPEYTTTARAGQLSKGDEKARTMMDRPWSTGGASRFFYCAKPNKSETERGLDHLPMRSGGEATDREDGSDGLKSPRAGAGRNGGSRNFHPTKKPVALMTYLIRLITPPGGTVLDLFAGSGTTGVAAIGAGFDFVGVEKDPDYIPIIAGRLEHARREYSAEAERKDTTP